jgi:hypothetical protein
MNRRHRAGAIAVVAGAALTTGAAVSATMADPHPAPHSRAAVARVHPAPAQFTNGRVTNPWFPLKPGNRLVYRGSEDGNRLRDTFFVTYRTKVVDGVTCRAVHDKVFENGILVERTTDWYAQTKAGTVWYFGERTAELNRRGQVTSREGSFLSGRDGAEAGIFMPAHPAVGQSFVQEDYPGHAEDRFEILDLSAHVRVPLVRSRNAMLTKETTPLEPGVVDHKYYVRDIGTVREATVRGGSESLRLVSITHVPR